MLIVPRIGFVAAKLIVPTKTSQSVYLEKTALRENFNAELEERKKEIHQKFWKDRPKASDEQMFAVGECLSDESVDFFASTYGKTISTGAQGEQPGPLEGAYKQKFSDRTDQIDRNYQREKARSPRKSIK